MKHRTLIRLILVLAVAACRRAVVTEPSPVGRRIIHSVVPNPSTIDVSPADSFLVTPRTMVFIGADAPSEVEAIGNYAADLIASRIRQRNVSYFPIRASR